MKTYDWFVMVFSLIMLSGMGSTASANAMHAPPDTLHFEKPADVHPDSIEYELIILDPGFDSWFVGRSLPESFYTQTYLESWNRILSDQWNAMLPSERRRSCIPTTYLNYESRVDYGMTLNHQLFYYFRYVQEKCRAFTSFPGAWR